MSDANSLDDPTRAKHASPRHFRMPLLGLALLVAAASLSSCASRPTSSELSEAVLEAADNDPAIDLGPDEALCIASELLASNLSDETLQGLVENFNQPKVLASEQDEVKPLVAMATVNCSA